MSKEIVPFLLCVCVWVHMQASGGMSVSKEHSQGFQTCLPALIDFFH